MTRRWVWDKKKQELVEVSLDEKPRAEGPYIMGDLPAYKSPLGTGVIEGRAARREDLKRGGCREVDPSERVYQPRTSQQLAEQRAYLKARDSSPYRMDPGTAERLMKG